MLSPYISPSNLGDLAKQTEIEPTEIMQALQSGDVSVLDRIYAAYREEFYRWAKRRFQCTVQDMEDAWQEAIFAFYEQVTAGKLTVLRHSPRTWLFAIGYRRLLNYHRKTKRIFWKDSIDDALVKDPVFQTMLGDEPLADEKEMLLSAMKKVSPQCGDLLRQRYFLEKNIPEIQASLGFQSANVLSVSLSRCLKRLKEIIKSKQP